MLNLRGGARLSTRRISVSVAAGLKTGRVNDKQVLILIHSRDRSAFAPLPASPFRASQPDGSQYLQSPATPNITPLSQSETQPTLGSALSVDDEQCLPRAGELVHMRMGVPLNFTNGLRRALAGDPSPPSMLETASFESSPQTPKKSKRSPKHLCVVLGGGL